MPCRAEKGELEGEAAAAYAAMRKLDAVKHQRERDQHFAQRYMNSLRGAEAGRSGNTRTTVLALMDTLSKRMAHMGAGSGDMVSERAPC